MIQNHKNHKNKYKIFYVFVDCPLKLSSPNTKTCTTKKKVKKKERRQGKILIKENDGNLDSKKYIYK